MTAATTLTEPPCIFPTFRYRDAAAMIDWLADAFGFEVRARYTDDDGMVQHAELMLGSSIIMIGTARDDGFGNLVGAPGPNGGKAVYIAVNDVEAMHARAEAAEAKMLEGLVERSYGSKEFICADPEGNVWSFGTYWPKANEAAD
ncbi:putative glyoxalase superfamily protein PhnB [Pseudaminobacter salicylatoxidans]|uniref:Putative glyoxalase superfamily protein PhnB n=1 Tax=Pseudaminobacter salicylatoxidans TaxID=93369 RepID=A0A316BUE0_PSESE|nr:VOC family protein [Pseudaminobacter salicylatoxidans]PWJ77603.1 putative glyoxalase superfamily protein PhnB [Pseudaminobacter salicylatoxidans]